MRRRGNSLYLGGPFIDQGRVGNSLAVNPGAVLPPTGPPPDLGTVPDNTVADGYSESPITPLKAVADATPNCDFVILGDSMAFHWQSVADGDTDQVGGRGAYRAFTSRRTAPLVFGFSGARTQQVMNCVRSAADGGVGLFDNISPTCVMIQCGTNNTPDPGVAEDVAAGMLALAYFVRLYSPSSRVILTSILPRSDATAAERQVIVDANAIAAADPFIEGYWVRWLEIHDEFVDGSDPVNDPFVDVYFGDHIHPALYGYQRFAELAEPDVTEIFGLVEASVGGADPAVVADDGDSSLTSSVITFSSVTIAEGEVLVLQCAMRDSFNQETMLPVVTWDGDAVSPLAAASRIGEGSTRSWLFFIEDAKTADLVVTPTNGPDETIAHYVILENVDVSSLDVLNNLVQSSYFIAGGVDPISKDSMILHMCAVQNNPATFTSLDDAFNTMLTQVDAASSFCARASYAVSDGSDGIPKFTRWLMTDYVGGSRAFVCHSLSIPRSGAAVPAAPSRVDASLTTGTVAASASLTLISGYTVSDSAHKLVALVSLENQTSSDFSITSAQWNGANLTPAVVETHLGGHAHKLAFYYLDGPTPGTGNIVVQTGAATMEVGYATAFLVQGAAAGVSAFDSDEAASGQLDSSITVADDYSIVYTGYGAGTNVNLSPTGTGVDISNIASASPSGGSGLSEEEADSGSLAYGWSTGATRILIAAVAFSPSS